MSKRFSLVAAVCLVAAFIAAGCAQKKAANSQEAIAQSKELKTVEEQARYLVSQANQFINSKEFDQAIATAQHVLSNLDANSTEAKSIIEKAKDEMKKMAAATVADMKSKLGSFGK